jgi:glycine/D-amino acid oxidase-like deaminating enzyme
MSLTDLEARLRADLACLDYPSKPWLPPQSLDGQPVLDVLIIGAGQGGLATAFGLMREKIGNILVVDQAPRGGEGVWTTFARMVTLRTPKHVCGPDLGIGSLTPRAWYEARFGAEAWAALGKLPREVWQDYLDWYRTVLDLPVRNDTGIVDIARQGRFLAATTDRGAVLLARKIVLATGIAGSGAWLIPDFIEANIPRNRYAHTSEATSQRLPASASACWGRVPRPSTMRRRRWKRAPGACSSAFVAACCRASIPIAGWSSRASSVSSRNCRISCAGASCGTSSP